MRLQLFGANAADAGEIIQRLRIAFGDGGQCGVVEDHIGGQVVFARHFCAPSFEQDKPRLRRVIQGDSGFGQGGLGTR